MSTKLKRNRDFFEKKLAGGSAGWERPETGVNSKRIGKNHRLAGKRVFCLKTPFNWY
jgi:hypothetical protein